MNTLGLEIEMGMMQLLFFSKLQFYVYVVLFIK